MDIAEEERSQYRYRARGDKSLSLINIVLSAAMLFRAIYDLFYVQDLNKPLGIVAGYTVVVAACIALSSNARRSEIFGACAAYAAVLVVFVSGNLDNS